MLNIVEDNINRQRDINRLKRHQKKLTDIIKNEKTINDFIFLNNKYEIKLEQK